MPPFTSFGLIPNPDVELAWGSASINNVLYSSTARLAARLMAEVVLPTPPFWFAIAMIFPILIFKGSSQRTAFNHGRHGGCTESTEGLYDGQVGTLILSIPLGSAK